MFQHVTVKHPFARIVCDERYFDGLIAVNEERVSPVPVSNSFPITRDDTEVVTMDVHGMRPAGLIDRFNENSLADCCFEQGALRHIGNAIKRPDLLVLHHCLTGQGLPVE